ncbi:MAG: type II toxin-antitoxin system VapC family toxin [Syntrophothermus sp.]
MRMKKAKVAGRIAAPAQTNKKDILVDTTILIDHLRGLQEARQWLVEMFQSGRSLYYSVITRAELLTGVRPGEQDALLKLLGLMRGVNVDDTIASIAAGYMQKYARSHGLSLPDALIAASARQSSAGLATLNRKHFPMTDLTVIVPY